MNQPNFFLLWFNISIANEVTETLTKMSLFEKCLSFTGDNCNSNFGCLTRPKGNNVFPGLKNDLPTLVGVGCSALILNNCSRHGTNQMTIDVVSIIYKPYQYFCIYTVRTEYRIQETTLPQCNKVAVA